MSRSWRRVLPAVVIAGALVAACGGSGTNDGAAAPVTTSPPSGATQPPASTTPPGSSTSSTVAAATYEDLTVPAPALAGNRLGDPSELKVSVEVPASYASEPNRRYPVVYFLAGYDEPNTAAPVGVALTTAVAAGAAPEMIVVAVSGDNALGGSFYTDSPVSGNWATAITRDLVTAIDAKYRTLPTPESRGIAGFSMGGYGALALASAHPDVFGAVYALSPGLFAPDGLAQSQMFAKPSVIADVLAGRAELATVPAQEAAAKLRQTVGRNGDSLFSAAYGVAFAPDPAAPPPWFAYPYKTAGGPVDQSVWARWDAGYGGLAPNVAANRQQWLALRGILIDVGVRDEYAWIPPGAVYLHEQLDKAGVPNQLVQYEGGHGPVGRRAGEAMVPFFAKVLQASSA